MNLFGYKNNYNYSLGQDLHVNNLQKKKMRIKTFLHIPYIHIRRCYANFNSYCIKMLLRYLWPTLIIDYANIQTLMDSSNIQLKTDSNLTE